MKPTVLALLVAAPFAVPLSVAQAQTYQQQQMLSGKNETGNVGPYGFYRGRGMAAYAYAPGYRYWGHRRHWSRYGYW
jgi:hypothetical protein